MGWDIHSVAQILTEGEWVTVETHFYERRAYDMFGMLAGIRNQDPIVEPRGFPKDFEVDDNDVHEKYWMGYHTHSYLFLNELQNACKLTGFLSEEDYLAKNWKNITSVISFTEPVVIVTEYAYPNEITDSSVKKYISVEKNKDIPDDLPELIERLRSIADEYNLNSNEVRIVFGFDN